MRDDTPTTRKLAPIAAMRALVADGIVAGGDTVLTFQRGDSLDFDVIVGPDRHDNYVQAAVWLHTDGEYACSCHSSKPLRGLLDYLDSTGRATIAAEVRAQRAYDGKSS